MEIACTRRRGQPVFRGLVHALIRGRAHVFDRFTSDKMRTSYRLGKWPGYCQRLQMDCRAEAAQIRHHLRWPVERR